MKNEFPALLLQCPAGNERIDVVNPSTLEKIGHIQAADEDSIEHALQSAADLHQRKSPLPAEERIRILRKTADLMSERAEDFALGAAEEGGKPLVDSRAEVARAIDGIHVCIETLRTRSGREIPMGLNKASEGKIAFTSHEPIGPVLAYSAFNHPVNLIIHQVIPAVATGCPVIVKPAADTPLSCYRIVDLLREAGLPPEWCQAANWKGHELSSQVASDPRIAFLTFIGSPKVGWMLRSRLAPGTRCALEHGGAAPVIISQDADLDDLLPRLVKAGFYHAGQVCVSAQRVFIHSSIIEDVQDRLTRLVSELKIGPATEESTDVGPLIRPAEQKRIHEWVHESGGEVITGGEPEGNVYYRPTLLREPRIEAKVSQEEIFGPVLNLYAYDDLADAIRRANDIAWSFQASIFSRDIDTILQAYRGLNGTAIMANEHPAFRVDWMPFAGAKESGHGTGGMPYTMDDMQVEKMLIIRSASL